MEVQAMHHLSEDVGTEKPAQNFQTTDGLREAQRTVHQVFS